MELFDRLICRYPLLDAAVQNMWFQTKSLDRRLDTYTLTEDGRLEVQVRRREWVPEAQRPYYGQPEWETNPILQLAGMLRSVPDGVRAVPHEGPLVFYVLLTGGVRIEYHAQFQHGQLVDLTEQRFHVA